MKVDLRASDAVAPWLMAVAKCWVSSVVAGAARESDGTSPMTMETKSAIAPSGFALDHCVTPAGR